MKLNELFMSLKNMFKSEKQSTDNAKQPSDDSQFVENRFLQTEEKIVRMLKTVFDPEIPVNVYDLGLIYKVDLQSDGSLIVDMTMTAPNCPAADFIVEDVRQKLQSIDEIKSVTINLVFEPEWTKDMMSEEAKLELNML